MRFANSLRVGAAGTFLTVSSFLAVGGEVTVNEVLPYPGHMRGSITTEACSNNPGPYITLSGELTLGAIDAKLIFRNNERGTHEREEETTVSISLSPERVISFNKQPPLGGVGGNPFIFLELCDGEWNTISERVLLGRCVQGTMPVDMGFANFASIFATIAGSCENNPGPWITLDGDIHMGGLNARLVFQNSPRPNAPHQREEETELRISLVEQGGEIRFSKQPPLGGVGGNPRIYVQFESGGECSPEIYLGRCVQLSR